MLLISVGTLFAANNTKSIKMASKNDRQRVEIKTTDGDIVIELYNETPLHRDNFIKLVKENYYDSVLFHRVIKDFMIQTGDGNSKNAVSGRQYGDGDPGYTIDAEIRYPQFFHKRGALAAARTGDQMNPERKSSGSQFYIVTGKKFTAQQLDQMEKQMEYRAKQDLFQKLASPYRKDIMKLQMQKDTAGVEKLRDELIRKTEEEYKLHPATFNQEQRDAYENVGGAPHLDGQYTVFGEVISGWDVIEKIEKAETDKNDRPKEDIKIIDVKLLNNGN